MSYTQTRYSSVHLHTPLCVSARWCRYRQVEYQDNQAIITLFEAKRDGLFALLNEQCLIPRGSDQTFAIKVPSLPSSSPSFLFYMSAIVTFDAIMIFLGWMCLVTQLLFLFVLLMFFPRCRCTRLTPAILTSQSPSSASPRSV